MKNYMKFTAIFLALAVLLSIPAFALSDGWGNVKLNDGDWRKQVSYYHEGILTFVDGTYNANSKLYNFPLPSLDGTSSLFLNFHLTGDMQFSVSAGDTVTIDSFGFTTIVSGIANYITSYRVTLGTTPLNPDFTSPWFNVPFNDGGGSPQQIQYSGDSFQVTKDIVVSQINVELIISHPTAGPLFIGGFSASVGFGNPDSPQAPGYNKPDGGAIDDYHDLEQDVLNDTELGMNAANGIFGSFVGNIFGFVSGLLFVSQLMGLFVAKVPVVGLLIQISLALGLFGVLVGLSGSIIGAKERHDRNVQYRNRVYWERFAANNRRKMREARGSRRKK